MSRDALLELVADADPMRLLDDVDWIHDADTTAASAALLDEIVQTQPVDPRTVAHVRKVRRQRQLSLRARILVPIAGAAALTGVLGIPIVMHQDDTTSTTTSPPATVSPSSSPSDSDLPVTRVRYAAAAVRVAEANPRLLITADGWKVRSLEGFEPTAGDMSFQSGPDKWVREDYDADGNVTSSTLLPDGPDSPAASAPSDAPSMGVSNMAPSVSVAWYPRSEYDVRRASRAEESGSSERQVLGVQALLVPYSDDENAVVLPPEGEVFLEVRGSNLSRADFLRLLDNDVARVGVRTWLAALPPEIVTAKNAGDRLSTVLQGVPRTPGFRAAEFDGDVALDPYQFGAKVAGQVVCGWIGAWEQATQSGDETAAAEAVSALAGSRDWKFLNDMDAEGDYPEVVWQISDEVVAGNSPEGYRGALGC